MNNKLTNVVTFEWEGAPTALPTNLVIGLADDPAIAPLANPLGGVAEVVAYGSDLYPLLCDPEFSDKPPQFTTVIVARCGDHHLALQVGPNVDVVSASYKMDAIVEYGDNKTALVIDIEELLERTLL